MTGGIPAITERQAAVTAGFGLLLMAVLTPFAHFYVLQSLVRRDDAAATVSNLIASGALFRSSVLVLLVVVILDLVVAWALYVLYKPVNQGLSLLAALCRSVYAALFGGALTDLFNVLPLLSGTDYLSAYEPGQLDAQVMLSISAFKHGWDIGLVIFGLHLLILGWLVYKSGPRILGLLVALAGGGYIGDSVGGILVPGYSMTLSTFTFVGEAILIVWLFWRGGRTTPATTPLSRAH